MMPIRAGSLTHAKVAQGGEDDPDIGLVFDEAKDFQPIVFGQMLDEIQGVDHIDLLSQKTHELETIGLDQVLGGSIARLAIHEVTALEGITLGHLGITCPEIDHGQSSCAHGSKRIEDTLMEGNRSFSIMREFQEFGGFHRFLIKSTSTLVAATKAVHVWARYERT